ncbi:MAG: transcription termination/antitermination NusG family protein [Deltaproteobacteria bacterium]|nr:transcription termination/antitermination NusG family protein [Deltaproteobacteria bacterium]
MKQVNNLRWYVVQTLCRNEAVVESALRQKDQEVYLPRIKVPSRRRDRKLFLRQPLFPGYLFIRTELDPRTYLDIRRTRGVVKILGRQGGFEPVPDETLESIRIMEKSGLPLITCPPLRRGMRVYITAGLLAGARGVIQKRLEKKHRLVVSVELFQRAVAVELDEDFLKLCP